MKCIPRRRKRFQLPDLFDWADSRDICGADYRVRYVAGRCRVSPSTAKTIFELACLSNGERHR
jgi:hypothetical protein